MCKSATYSHTLLLIINITFVTLLLDARKKKEVIDSFLWKPFSILKGVFSSSTATTRGPFGTSSPTSWEFLDESGCFLAGQLRRGGGLGVCADCPCLLWLSRRGVSLPLQNCLTQQCNYCERRFSVSVEIPNSHEDKYSFSSNRRQPLHLKPNGNKEQAEGRRVQRKGDTSRWQAEVQVMLARPTGCTLKRGGNQLIIYLWILSSEFAWNIPFEHVYRTLFPKTHMHSGKDPRSVWWLREESNPWQGN